MPETTAAASQETTIRDRIIVALDVETAEKAREISRELDGYVGAYKIGLQLFTAAGPDLVREFTNQGIRVFLDLKFHDIPNTVAKAAVEAVRLGVWMFNVHTAGGSEMMRTTVQEVDSVCLQEGLQRPLVIGVTVLTSADAALLKEIGVESDVDGQVRRLAELAESCGLDGVVASPLEARMVKSTVNRSNFMVVTPGIRGTNATSDDQRRVTTVRQALAEGSDYVVIGRPIVEAYDRIKAIETMING
jgi:orotidine-5'-phosphate decarboxylase